MKKIKLQRLQEQMSGRDPSSLSTCNIGLSLVTSNCRWFANSFKTLSLVTSTVAGLQMQMTAFITSTNNFLACQQSFSSSPAFPYHSTTHRKYIKQQVMSLLVGVPPFFSWSCTVQVVMVVYSHWLPWTLGFPPSLLLLTWWCNHTSDQGGDCHPKAVPLDA